MGHEFQGLFLISSPSSSTACTSMDTPLLIQRRLGRPNISKFRIMVLVFLVYPQLSVSCQFGKHTRVSFPKRLDQRTKSHFELVH